ncbi:MAG: ATP-binding cassette domain-containing protein, partial [Spirochaetaceae bacterium]|nr:ATP-binding cassette domain-containing protein [Spirochaetaceae bacterium]
MMPVIRLEGVGKRFGETVLFEKLDFSVPAGSVTCLLGPSGCGKTTMLRMIAGLEDPDAGEIRVGDKIIYSSAQVINTSAKKRKMGLVFQSYALWPHMTVFDNIAFPLKA